MIFYSGLSQVLLLSSESINPTPNSAQYKSTQFPSPAIYAGEGNGTPLWYSCLENPMDGGVWWAAVHGVTKSQTWLNDFTFTLHFHSLEKEMATHSSVLASKIPGTGSLVGCRLWGCTESDTTEATYQQQQRQYIQKKKLKNVVRIRVKFYIKLHLEMLQKKLNLLPFHIKNKQFDLKATQYLSKVWLRTIILTGKSLVNLWSTSSIKKVS